LLPYIKSSIFAVQLESKQEEEFRSAYATFSTSDSLFWLTDFDLQNAR